MASSAELEVASNPDTNGVTAARHRNREGVASGAQLPKPKVPKQRLVSSKTREANELGDSSPHASRSSSPNEQDGTP